MTKTAECWLNRDAADLVIGADNTVSAGNCDLHPTNYRVGGSTPAQPSLSFSRDTDVSKQWNDRAGKKTSRRIELPFGANRAEHLVMLFYAQIKIVDVTVAVAVQFLRSGLLKNKSTSVRVFVCSFIVLSE